MKAMIQACLIRRKESKMLLRGHTLLSYSSYRVGIPIPSDPYNYKDRKEQEPKKKKTQVEHPQKRLKDVEKDYDMICLHASDKKILDITMKSFKHSSAQMRHKNNGH